MRLFGGQGTSVMNHNKLLSVLIESRLVNIVLPGLSTIVVFAALYFVFLIAPNESTLGAVQRVFYFHVPSAIVSYLMLGVVLLSSISYLYTRKSVWDHIAKSAASIAFLFCCCVLVTGMIWGYSSWNRIWNWEPRLTSFLILWLVLLSYSVLRQYAVDDSRQAAFAAVLGILAALNVPVVIFSIKLWQDAYQLHPEVVAQNGLRDPLFGYGLIVAGLAILLLAVWLFLLKLRTVLLQEEIRSVSRRI